MLSWVSAGISIYIFLFSEIVLTYLVTFCLKRYETAEGKTSANTLLDLSQASR